MTNKAKRSGESHIDRDQDYCKRTWDEILDKTFTQTIFHSYPALLSKELVNGHRMWQPYYGGDYDKSKYDLVEGMWGP